LFENNLNIYNYSYFRNLIPYFYKWIPILKKSKQNSYFNYFNNTLFDQNYLFSDLLFLETNFINNKVLNDLFEFRLYGDFSKFKIVYSKNLYTNKNLFYFIIFIKNLINFIY
jgi:hypothetical protein